MSEFLRALNAPKGPETSYYPPSPPLWIQCLCSKTALLQCDCLTLDGTGVKRTVWRRAMKSPGWCVCSFFPEDTFKSMLTALVLVKLRCRSACTQPGAELILPAWLGFLAGPRPRLVPLDFHSTLDWPCCLTLDLPRCLPGYSGAAVSEDTVPTCPAVILRSWLILL